MTKLIVNFWLLQPSETQNGFDINCGVWSGSRIREMKTALHSNPVSKFVYDWPQSLVWVFLHTGQVQDTGLWMNDSHSHPEIIIRMHWFVSTKWIFFSFLKKAKKSCFESLYSLNNCLLQLSCTIMFIKKENTYIYVNLFITFCSHLMCRQGMCLDKCSV